MIAKIYGRGKRHRRILKLVEFVAILCIAAAVSLPLSTLSDSYRADVVEHSIPSGVYLLDNNTTLNTSEGVSPLTYSPPPPHPPPSTSENWPTYEQNQERTGVNPNEKSLSPLNATQLVQMWAAKTTAGIFGSAAVVNGSVYVGDFSGEEWGFSAATGTPLFSTPLGGVWSNRTFNSCSYPKSVDAIRGITATATVWNGMVFVPEENNSLYALYATNGTLVNGWSVNLSSEDKNDSGGWYPFGSSLVYNGHVFIGTASGCDNPMVEGQLLQINITTHSIDHFISMAPGAHSGGAIWSTPTLEPSTSTVWVTTGNCPTVNCSLSTQNWTQAIVALNAQNVCQPHSSSCTSKGYWHLATGSDVDFGAGATLFSLSNGTKMVVAENKNGGAYAFYADNLKANGGNTPVWHVNVSVSHGDISPAAFDGTTLYFGGAGNSTLHNGTYCANGTIRAVNPSNGSVRWDQCAKGSVMAGLTYANGLIIDGTSWADGYGGTLEVRNASTGVVLISWSFPQAITGEPVVSDGRIFFGTGNATVFCGTPHCPPGHLYAYGIPLGSSSSMKPTYGGLAAPGYCGGVYSWGNATGGMPTYNFTWAWGSSYYSYTRDPFHLYCAGQYYPSMTITDAAGENVTQMWSVLVNTYTCSNQTFPFCSITSALPCITFGALKCFTGPFVEPVTFGSRITWGLSGVTWDWNFGDGTAHSSALSPTHTYSSHGTYAVTVTVTNSEHVQYQQSFQVTV